MLSKYESKSARVKGTVRACCGLRAAARRGTAWARGCSVHRKTMRCSCRRGRRACQMPRPAPADASVDGANRAPPPSLPVRAHCRHVASRRSRGAGARLAPANAKRRLHLQRGKHGQLARLMRCRHAWRQQARLPICPAQSLRAGGPWLETTQRRERNHHNHHIHSQPHQGAPSAYGQGGGVGAGGDSRAAAPRRVRLRALGFAAGARRS